METRPDDNADIAKRFRALRRKVHLSQSHPGSMVGICRQSVSEIENIRVMPRPGTWKNPSNSNGSTMMPRS
jgi:DNA-binding XRE family transcriptional regulator